MPNELRRADRGWSGILRSWGMSDRERANAANRNIVEYHPCAVDAFFEAEQGVYNGIISGGDSKIRTNAMVAQAICASYNKFPVIVLHQGNRNLEYQLRSFFLETGKYQEISSSSPCFEPFYGLTELELSNQILETVPKHYDIQVNVRYYIEGISTFLNKSGKNRSFHMLSTCPHALLFDKVDELLTNGIITVQEEQEIKSKLMMGQSENYKLDTVLASLKMEMEPMMYIPERGVKPVNIISSIRDCMVLSFDINSVTNTQLLNTIIYQLKLALTRGYRYTIIIDSIPINANEAYATYIRTPADKVCKLFSSEDYYAMLSSDDQLFAATVGNSQIVIVMNHTAGHSAVKWAEVFGQCDQYEQSYSNAKGASKSTPWALISSPNYQNTVNINKSREYVVKPELITRMRQSEAYVLSAARGEMAHLMLNG